MFRSTHLAFGCCLFLVTLASPAAADKIADIEKELIKASKALHSYSATVKTTQDMAYGDGSSSKMASVGTYEWSREDGVTMYRIDADTNSVQIFSGNEMKSVTQSTMICDGKFNYTLSNSNGQKSAMKMKANPTQSADVQYAFSTMRESYNLKVLPDETVDGHDCYVIEATAKQTENNPMVKNVNFFAKDLGLNIRAISHDANDKIVFRTDTTDIKKNLKIDASRFVFQAPPGVEVMEMPGM